VQLFLDPYFRTFHGFLVLVDKEWLSFGHKMQTRHGHAGKDHDNTQRSPIFLQFLDAVWQLTQMFPAHFEFNAAMLSTIAEHLFSCRFGTFLGNCEKDREEMQTAKSTPSLWSFLQRHRVARFMNPFFRSNHKGTLMPSRSQICRSVRLWDDYFLRWSPLPSIPMSYVPRQPPGEKGKGQGSTTTYAPVPAALEREYMMAVVMKENIVMKQRMALERKDRDRGIEHMLSPVHTAPMSLLGGDQGSPSKTLENGMESKGGGDDDGKGGGDDDGEGEGDGGGGAFMEGGGGGGGGQNQRRRLG
jgi:hypothetical protein